MLAVQVETYLIGIDTFGFLYGMYGIQLDHPVNIIVSSIVIIFYALLALLLSSIVERVTGSKFSYVYSAAGVLLLYFLTMKHNLYPSLFFDGLVFIFVGTIYHNIENQPENTEDSLRSTQRLLILFFLTVVLISVINYIMWFFRREMIEGLDALRKNPVPSFLLFLTQLDQPYSVELGWVKYIENGEDFKRFYLIGVYSSFVLRGAVSIYFISTIWFRINEIIALMSRTTDVWRFLPTEGKVTLQLIDPASGDVSQVLNHRPKYKHDKLMELQHNISSDLEELFGAELAASSNWIDLSAEQRLKSIGRELGNNIDLTTFLSKYEFRKIPILLVNEAYGDPMLEHVWFEDSDTNLQPFSRFVTPIHYLNQPGLPVNLSRKRKILHIGSNDLNSLLLQRKIESYVQNSNHLLEFIKIETLADLNIIQDTTLMQWDILIISLHSSRTEGNNIFFEIHSADPLIIPEKRIVESITTSPHVVLVPSCKLSTPDSSTDFAMHMLQKGSVFVLSSISPVLSSHTPLILLPALESLLEANLLDVYEVKNVAENIRRTIDKFGYQIQWTPFRTAVRMTV